MLVSYIYSIVAAHKFGESPLRKVAASIVCKVNVIETELVVTASKRSSARSRSGNFTIVYAVAVQMRKCSDA